MIFQFKTMLQFITIILSVVASFAALSPPRPVIHIDGNHGGSGKIINGRDADEGEFPYIASLNYGEAGHFCGASIINTFWLVTAAHCCIGLDQYVYTSSIYLSSGGLSFNISKIHVHPYYDPKNFWLDDICLVKVVGHIPLGSDAQQIRLPRYGSTVPENSPVVVAGWGFTTAEAPQEIPDRLQVITKYFTYADCNATTEVPNYVGQMCAVGESGQGICQGDSGGSLVFNETIVGIASFGFLPCASEGYPDFYTRVSNYIPWIYLMLAEDASSLKFAED